MMESSIRKIIISELTISNEIETENDYEITTNINNYIYN